MIQPRLTKTELIFGLHLKDCHYEAGMGPDQQGNGIVVPIKIKSHNTTFGLGFQSTRWDITIAKKNGEMAHKRE